MAVLSEPSQLPKSSEPVALRETSTRKSATMYLLSIRSMLLTLCGGSERFIWILVCAQSHRRSLRPGPPRGARAASRAGGVGRRPGLVSGVDRNAEAP